MGILGDAIATLKAVLPGGAGRGPIFWNWGDTFWPHSVGLAEEQDYSRLVGDGTGSTLVASVLGWIARAFQNPPPVVTEDDPSGIRIIVPRHPAAELLRRPTWDPRLRRSWYSGALLRAALVLSYWVDGNAYALKVRDRLLRVVQLWYVPHWMIEPRGAIDGSTFLTHYDYTPAGTTLRLDPSEIWHIRQGIDPRNPLKGWSGLKTALREIYTDEKAAHFAAALLKNGARPGVILAPRNDSKKTIAKEDRDAIKVQFIQDFGGDNIGAPMVFGQPTELTEFGFSPEQLKLGDIRDVPEERLTAITGIPAAVVGFGTGLQGVKVGATLREYREQAWDNSIIPTLQLFAEEYDGQVLPDFVGDRDLVRLQTGWDLRDVRALLDTELAKAKVAGELTGRGLLSRDEGRGRVGHRPIGGPLGEAFLTQPGVEGEEPPAPAAPGDESEEPAA